MGLCFVFLVRVAGLLRPRLSRSDSLSRPAPSARFNLMRFPAPGAAGAFREVPLEASSVCLLVVAVDARSTISAPQPYCNKTY